MLFSKPQNFFLFQDRGTRRLAFAPFTYPFFSGGADQTPSERKMVQLPESVNLRSWDCRDYYSTSFSEKTLMTAPKQLLNSAVSLDCC